MLARTNQRVGTDYGWLGENAERNGAKDEAKSFYANALPFHEKMFSVIEELAVRLPDDQAVQRNRIAGHAAWAETLNRNGRNKEALGFAQKALNLATEMQTRDDNREAIFDVAEGYLLLAKIFEGAEQLEAALENTKRVLRLFDRVFQKDRVNLEAAGKLIDGVRKLAVLYQRMKNDPAAASQRKRLGIE